MPCVTVSVPETHESIVRPICFSVVRNLLTHTGLPEDTKVSFPGTDNQMIMPGSEMGRVERGENKFKSTENIQVDITEEYVEQHVLTTAVKRQENVLTFIDDRLGVYIRPVYSPVEVTFTVTYRAKDRVSAERWRDDIKTRVSQHRETLFHELKYSYPIPREFLVILHHIHSLRERKGAYGEDLKKWMNDCFNPRVSAKVTQAGTQPLLVINEAQVGVEGYFDFSAAPEPPERESEFPSWNINFTYKLVYDKPTACTMNYPLMIHNQVVNSKFMDKKPFYNPDYLINHWSLSRYNFDTMRGAYNFRSPVAGYPIPHWDDWMPRFVPPFTTTMLRIMVAVDEDDPTNVMSFNDLPEEYRIKQKFLQFMRSEAPWATKPGESVVLVTLFKDEIPLEHTYITMDSDLNVRATVPLDVRSRYHVRLALVNDLFTLSRSASERLRRNGEICLDVLNALNKELGAKGQLPKPIGNNYITRKDFEKAAQAIKDTSRPHQSNIEITRMHVGQFVVVAEKEGDK